MLRSAIAFSAWIWTETGCAAAIASARGGGVKRQPAATQKIASTISISTPIERASLCCTSVAPASADAVSFQRLTAASVRRNTSSASLMSSSLP